MGDGTYWDGTPYMTLDEIIAKYGEGTPFEWRANALPTEGLGGDVVRSEGDGDGERGLAALPKADPLRYTPSPRTPLVIHLVAESGPAERRAKCGVTKGRAWPRDPSEIALIVDKWCSRCWNKWAKERAAAA